MNSTFFALMAEFNTADIPLKLISQKYFGLSERQACDKARHQQLPVPCYRGGSQKSEWLISAAELANYIDHRREKARHDWNRLNTV